MTPAPHGVRRAFTLAELLVAIGIVAVLVSLLLPTLNKVRDLAKTVKCLSNLRQLALANTMYVSQWNGWAVPGAIGNMHGPDSRVTWNNNSGWRSNISLPEWAPGDNHKDRAPPGLLCPAAMLAHVCATQRDHRSQGSDCAGGFPTKAACRAGPGRSPKCSAGTTGRPASQGRRLAGHHAAESSARLALRTAGRYGAVRCSETVPWQRADSRSVKIPPHVCGPSQNAGGADERVRAGSDAQTADAMYQVARLAAGK